MHAFRRSSVQYSVEQERCVDSCLNGIVGMNGERPVDRAFIFCRCRFIHHNGGDTGARQLPATVCPVPCEAVVVCFPILSAGQPNSPVLSSCLAYQPLFLSTKDRDLGTPVQRKLDERLQVGWRQIEDRSMDPSMRWIQPFNLIQSPYLLNYHPPSRPFQRGGGSVRLPSPLALLHSPQAGFPPTSTNKRKQEASILISGVGKALSSFRLAFKHNLAAS